MTETRSLSNDRHRARVLAMQSLCHREVHSGGGDDALNALATERGEPLDVIAYARVLCEQYEQNADAVDDCIEAVLKRWDLARLAPVDRNTVRVATVELVARNVPHQIVLNEAIEIAKEFGSDESSRFVNGVLDAVWKRVSED